jgi:nucleoside-triphosphatase THEP1
VSNKIVLIHGEQDGGKTTTLLTYLKDHAHLFSPHEIYGYVSLANTEKNWYRLKDLSSGEERLSMSEKEFPHATRWGRFFVDETVFSWANQTIIDHLDEAKLVVFDELGRFELAGAGFDKAFKAALKQTDLTIVATIRTRFYPQILARYGLLDSPIECIECCKRL